MRKYILFFYTISFFVLSCSKGDEIRQYEAVLTNNSGNILTVFFYSGDSLVKESTLNNLESTSCIYTSEFFEKFNTCDQSNKISLMRVVFDNGQGYICDFQSIDPSQELCFDESRSIFKKSSFNDLGNNRYEFIITEEDFNNAHDLPE